MEILRTPDERFASLPGYSFKPNYVEVDGLRIHYIDEGPKEARPILMLHGEPSWSFLYRKMIPIFANAGYRAIALDFVGFGRSDKLLRREDYSVSRHVSWTRAFLNRLNLNEITLVCQDWGGSIGLRMVADEPERFASVIAANTGLMVVPGYFDPLIPLAGRLPFLFHRKATVDDLPSLVSFSKWLVYSQTVPEFPVGQVIDAATSTELSPEVIAAYDAPFPDERYKAGVREFPNLALTEGALNRAAWKHLATWGGPFLTAFSDGDPITARNEKVLQEHFPGAKDQPHTTIRNAGHFLQEDQGEEFAEIVLNFLRRQTQDLSYAVGAVTGSRPGKEH